MKNYLFCGAKVFIACLVCSVAFWCFFDKSLVSGAASTNMIQDISDVYNYVHAPLKEKKYTIKVTDGHFYYRNSKDYDDAVFRKYYNKTVPDDRAIPTKSDGTCWATSMTSVLNYYGAKGKAENVYCQVVKQGIDDYGKGVLTKGLQSSKVDDLLNKMCTNFFNIKKKSSYSTSDIYNKAKASYSSKNVGILCGDDHAMCACGYATVDCTYLDTKKVQHAINKKFIVINWGVYKEDDNQQFFPVDKMNSKFGYVKVVNK